MSQPQTTQEWQEAVDIAHVWLLVDSARQYGLVTGGPEIDVNRCLELLEQGRQQGILPSPDAISQSGRAEWPEWARVGGEGVRAQTPPASLS